MLIAHPSLPHAFQDLLLGQGRLVVGVGLLG